MNTFETQKHTVSNEVMAAATAVAQKASIIDVRLVSVKANLSESRETTPTLFRPARSHAFRREPGRVIVMVTFVLELAYESDDAPTPAASVRATYALTYLLDEIDSFDDHRLDAFAQINGFFNGWPYWRELVSSVLGRMGIGPFTMPTFRVSAEQSERAQLLEEPQR